MSRKCKMLLVLVIMLGLADGARAYTYEWCNTSGDWGNPAIWDVMPSPSVEGCAIIIGGVTVNVTTDGQGAWDFFGGYHVGYNVINIAAGKELYITSVAAIGNGNDTDSDATGVVNVSGSFFSEQLNVGCNRYTTGIVNVYDGGAVEVGDWGCTVGKVNADGTGTINLVGGTMIITSALTINPQGLINIEAGYLKVVGNQVAQLSNYIANGRITAYNGAGAVATPIYTGGYTIVGVLPGLAYNINPSNGATLVPLNKTLTWTKEGYATGYDIYFGTDHDTVVLANHNSPEFKGNVSTNSYQPPDWFGRNIGQTYYWRVDETTCEGMITREGGTWSFCTEHVRPPLSLARGVFIDRQFTTIPPELWDTIEAADVQLIRYMGFDFAKVVLNPALFISGNTINTANMWYVDSVMDKFMAEGVPVVLCLHPEANFKSTYLGSSGGFTSLLGFYHDFAAYLSARWGVNELAFQLMSEPFNNYTAWNNMWPSMLANVRATMPNHIIILTGDQVGSIAGLVNDVNPDLTTDQNIYWGFSLYDPFEFTFQGVGIGPTYDPWLNCVPYPSSTSNNPADYILSTIPSNLYSTAYNAVNTYCDTPWNLTKQRAVLQPLNTWKANHPTSNPKIWCAEFGSIGREMSTTGGGPNPPERIQFINDRRQAFEESSIGWAYYSYNETFTCLKPTTQRVPFSKTPDYAWVDDTETLTALGVRSTPYAIYFWSEQSGNWADPNTWDLGVPNTGNTPGHDIFVCDNVTVSSSNQGSTDLHVGYAYSGTLNVSAGYTLNIDHSILAGQSAGTPGVMNLYGWVIAEHLHVGEVAGSSGTITIYSGGYLQIGTWGCDVGSETGGTGLVDLEGTGEMVALSTLAISATGRIDIEAGQLALLGDCRTRMQEYISWGRITGYDGAGTVNAPTFDGTYTRVTAAP